MSEVRFYLDDDSGERALLRALVGAGFDVVRSEDVGMHAKPDADHLAYASAVGRAVVTANRSDFMNLHWRWLQMGRDHGGIIISLQAFSVGERVRRLSNVAASLTADRLVNRIEFLSDFAEPRP